MSGAVWNLVFFKIGWLACILAAAAGNPALATAAVAAVVVLHLARVPVPAKEAVMLACAGLMGLAWETFMVYSGLLTYPGYEASGLFAPYWIVSMWVLFATTVNHGFRWIKRNLLVASLFGALGGPMAFFSGAAMGAVEFNGTLLALSVIGAGWAVLLPVLVLVSDTIIDSEWLEPRNPVQQGRPSANLVNHLGGLQHRV